MDTHNVWRSSNNRTPRANPSGNFGERESRGVEELSLTQLLTQTPCMCIYMYMPTRNIYVAEADVQLFDEAASLAGGMSPAVAAGLRLYVAQQRAHRKRSTMDEIDVEVQDGPIVTTQRFVGRKLLSYQEHAENRVTTYRVFLTERQQIAIHTRNDPDWRALGAPTHSEINPDGEIDHDAVESDAEDAWAGQWWVPRSRALHVYPSIDDAAAHLPDQLATAIRRALAQPVVDVLDI